MEREISRLESIALATIATTALLAASAGLAYYGVKPLYDKMVKCQAASADEKSKYVRLDENEYKAAFKDGSCLEKELLK